MKCIIESCKKSVNCLLMILFHFLILSVPFAVLAQHDPLPDYDHLAHTTISADLELSPVDEGEVLSSLKDPEPLIEPESRGPHFLSGNFVEINEDLLGDVYVMASTVRLNAIIYGDLFVIARDLVINGEVKDNLRAIAVELEINGQIGDDISVMAETLNFTQSSQVGNSVIALANHSNYDGRIGGNVHSISSSFRTAGTFGSNLHLRSETNDFDERTNISGSLIAHVSEPITQIDVISVEGDTDISIVVSPRNHPSYQEFHSRMKRGINTLTAIMSILTVVIGSKIIKKMAPTQFKKLELEVTNRTGACIIKGILIVFLTPVLIVMIASTILGIPISLLSLLVLIILLMSASWIPTYVFGKHVLLTINDKFGHWTVEQLKDWHFLVLGAVLIQLILLLPIIGVTVRVLLVLVGMGAASSLFINRFSSQNQS